MNKHRVCSIILVICLIISCNSTLAFATAKSANDNIAPAESNTVSDSQSILNLSTHSVSFEKNGYLYYSEIYAECKIVKVESSDNGVATASVRNLDTMTSIIAITPHKAGTATVTAYNDSGISENISVTVKKNWEKAYLKSICYFSAAYRTKYVYLSAPSGSVFTFKIKNKKYKAKIGKSGHKTVKLKKSLGYKTNIKYTVKKGSCTVSDSVKTYCNVYGDYGRIWSCQKTIPINLSNVKKGDKVYITVGGKTYKKKVKRGGKSKVITFKTKYTNGNYSSIRIRVIDKHKHKLYDSTRSIIWR